MTKFRTIDIVTEEIELIHTHEFNITLLYCSR